MAPATSAPGDERDQDFEKSAKRAHHKPGFNATVDQHEAHATQDQKNRRLTPTDPKDIPQAPLGERIRNKGKA
jgi:hypothetical protein